MKWNKSCYIVGAGDFAAELFQPTSNDLILCADGGFNHLQELPYTIDYFVGDNDSIACVPPEGVVKYEYPSEKDSTDMSLALDLGYSLGCRIFHLFGACGDRIDHFYANMQLMSRFAKSGCQIRLVDERFSLYCVHCGRISSSQSDKGKTISVFTPDAQAQGVSIQGLKYALQNETLRCTFPLGVSNESMGMGFEIRVTDGTLLVFSYDHKANQHIQITNSH